MHSSYFWAHLSPFIHWLLFLHLITEGLLPAPGRAGGDPGSGKNQLPYQFGKESASRPLVLLVSLFMQGAEGREDLITGLGQKKNNLYSSLRMV